MSKKLIAVAAAAALALTGLVAIPAQASVSAAYSTASISGGDTDKAANMYATAALATAGSAVIDVPSNDTLQYSSTTSRSSLLKVIVTAASGDVVDATASAGKIVADILDTASEAQDTKDGASTYSKTATGNVTFYVFTTSTAVQSLTIKVNGNTSVKYFKANAGPAYNMAVTAPSSIIAGLTPSTNNMVVKLTDLFGNAVTTGSNILSVTVNGAGGTIDGATTAVTATAYNTTDKGWGYKVASTTATGFGVGVSIAADPAQVTGFALPVKSTFVTFNATSAATAVAALEAQVAALKADYNALAAKWNKRVASKKAPKKAVALK
jgi:hypothetical protein